MDIIYLDFAKAFNKVDHDILLKKVIVHTMKGKVGMGIKNPSRMKIQSFHLKVVSRVPRGTYPASILFNIMISDIDENLNSSISRLFTYYTKASAKIRKYKDT